MIILIVVFWTFLGCNLKYFHMFSMFYLQQGKKQDGMQRQQCVSYLETVRNEAVNVVWRAHTASLDASNASSLQLLSQSTRSLTESVNAIVENVSREAPWQRECEAALRKIKVNF